MPGLQSRLVSTPEQEDLLSYGNLAQILTLWRTSDEFGFLAPGPVHPQQQTGPEKP
jgi:hypothetical protein